MTFFDTLKDANMKAIFKEIVWDRFKDGRTLNQIMQDMTFEQRIEAFTLTHRIMKVIGLPGWEEPMLLNREDPLCAEADA